MVDCVNSVAKYPLHVLAEGQSTCIAILNRTCNVVSSHDAAQARSQFISVFNGWPPFKSRLSTLI